jgi:ATP-dependent Lon protease
MANLDQLDEKLYAAFPGRVVRKDLVRQMKAGVNVPVYVLEYLLGKYCSSTDEEIIRAGLEHVRTTLSEHYARPDESERVKSYIRERRRYKIIDKVRVRLVESEDRYWAELMNMGVKNVDIPEAEVKRYDKLLLGGIWAILDIRYEAENLYRGSIRPFLIEEIKPIQLATLDIKEYATKRAFFTREEWIDVLMRAIGMEPTHPDFNQRKKMLFISRLIPMVERNFNFVELGPRNTGKSFVFREISPNAILISGGKTTVANLFMHLGTGKIGLVGLWDVVAFDEVSGIRFQDNDAIQILKDYMESGSFSRGREEIPAEASMVFNGNINTDVPTLLKTSHLFSPFPEEMQDMALIDRFHFYHPGWEIDKLKPDHFSNHFGFVVDYFAEILRELRKLTYTDIIDRYFLFGSHLNQRDVKAVRKTVSGLVKLLHPDGNVQKEELEEYLEFAMEMRRRIKEQLKKMGGMEYWAVNFSYIDKDTQEEHFVNVPEQGGSGFIPPGPLKEGVIFTIGTDTREQKHSLFRIEVQAMPGKGSKRITGAPSSAMRDAIQTAFDFVKANLKKLTVDKSINDYDLHIQVVNLMQSKEGSETGVAFFIAILSALLEKPVQEQLVVLGEMSIHGGLRKVDALTERLQLAMDSGAKKVMLPSENKRDFADIPSDILDKIQIIFYSDPVNAAFRAMGLG